MTRFRSLGLLVIFVATALLAFVTISPPAARGASAFGSPIVVVYPLTFAGSASGNEAGAYVAVVLSQKLAEAGGLTVKPPIPGTVRVQYLAAAISQRADYYVTGFMQTIGEDVSMIVQVVSTHSGSVVFSTTTTIRTFADAALQADPVHTAILRHAGRGLAALDAPAPDTSAQPSAAPTNGPGLNLTRALRKRQKSTPEPSATPTSDAGLIPVSQIERPPASPSPSGTTTAIVHVPATPLRAALVTPAPLAAPLPKVSAKVIVASQSVDATPMPTETASPSPAPSASAIPAVSRIRGRKNVPTASPTSAANASAVLVVDTSGDETADLLTRASNSLVAALRNVGIRVARLPIASDDARKNATSICAANAGTTRFYAPALILGHDDVGAAVARLSVASIDCTGATLATRTTSGFGNARGGDAFAIDRAVAKMIPLLAGV